MEDFEQAPESDVTSGGDTSSPDSSASSVPNQDAQSNGQTATPVQDDSKPFHEHPRFQELIQEKNQYKQQLSEYEKRLTDMNSRYEQIAQQLQQLNQPKTEDPFQSLFGELKQHNPAFASLQEKVYQASQAIPKLEETIRDLQGKLSQRETKELYTTVMKQFDDLCEQNKVPKDRREEYQALIENMANKNPRATPKDLPDLFKQVHETRSKYYDQLERSIRASYVQQKKTDSTPATQTGGVPAGGPKKEISREDMIKMIAKGMREGADKI